MTRVLFVTGKLAEPALRRVLAEADLPFSVDVAVMRITVAALMTTDWIARFLDVPAGTDLVMIPGLCEGDTGIVADRTRVRVEKGPKDLREISCEVNVLPRTHGSAIFQRGETQALVTTTLGTSSDEQRVDGLGDEYTKKFMLDYNFPPFSVGEVRPIRGPGRRSVSSPF